MSILCNMQRSFALLQCALQRAWHHDPLRSSVEWVFYPSHIQKESWLKWSRDSWPSSPPSRRLLFSSHSFPQKATDSQVESTKVKMLKGNFMTVVLSGSLFTRQDHPVSYLILRHIQPQRNCAAASEQYTAPPYGKYRDIIFTNKKKTDENGWGIERGLGNICQQCH